jgi:arginase
MLLLPWHLGDSLAGGLNVDVPPDTQFIVSSPGTSGSAWSDLSVLYEPLRDAVATAERTPVVLTGDCVSALAVLAGAQRSGLDPSLVWIDAHGDFHTEESTTSGYFGGLPLAKAVGRGDLTLPAALGIRPLPENRVVLVDGRDLDPAEVDALQHSSVCQVGLHELANSLPEGVVHLHIDLDVLDPSLLPGLRFPATGGATLAALRIAIEAVMRLRPIAAVSIAATWFPERSDRSCNQAALNAVLSVAG